MATSDIENKDIAEKWVREINPKTVVDIGAGEGTYSTLCRQDGQYWVGVEIFYPYIEMYELEKKYDKVVVGDIRYVELARLSPKPHLVIIGDVLEHLKKEEAKDVIDRLLAWADNVLISVPLLHLSQGAVNGNPYETHIDHWTHGEMVSFLGKALVKNMKGNILGYYLCNI